ncbi:MAG: site-2 protease family protein [Anaerolineae bacterium]|nr:site-2 protease family protein [Anaerolineae bacterium]
MSGIRLFTIGGIEIKMHITFPLILIVAAVQFGFLSAEGFSLSGALFGVVVTLILFVCVVLHELSHSLTAIRMGFPVRQIVLLPLGGVAQIERMPERPGQEFLMAIAGPLTNVVIAAALLAIGLPLQVGWLASLRKLALSPGELGWQDTLPYLVFTNLMLAAFNLLPAFPMDGGRVLRALLATVMPFARATALAVSIGQGLAWFLGLAGLLSRNIMWILIAVFVYSGAGQEGRMIQVRSVLRGLRVRQVFSRRAQTLSPNDPIDRAADLILESFQSDFPICDGKQIVGLLTHADIIQALKRHPPETAVRTVMRAEFPTARLDDELFEVHRKMLEAGIGAAPVIDKGYYLGLLTERDVGEVYQLLSVNPHLLGQRERE